MFILLILIHLLLAESHRRYQQHEEKEGLEKGACFHGGMIVELLNRLFVDLFICLAETTHALSVRWRGES